MIEVRTAAVEQNLKIQSGRFLFHSIQSYMGWLYCDDTDGASTSATKADMSVKAGMTYGKQTLSDDHL